MTRFLSFTFLWLLQITVWAQLPEKLSFQRYTTRDGLANNSCFNIVEDNQHFIWVSTAQGICRFDGGKIRSYSLEKNLNNTAIRTTQVLNDVKGGIWVVNFSSLLKYNPVTDDFEHKIEFVTKNTPAFSNKKVIPLFPITLDSARNCFWVMSDNQLLRFDFKTEKLVFISKIDIENPQQIARLNSNTLIVSSNRSWILYNINTQKQTKVATQTSILKIHSDGYNHLWYSDEAGKLWQTYFDNDKLTPPALIQNFSNQSTIYTITTLPHTTGDSLLWCGVGDLKAGLHLIDIRKDKSATKDIKNITYKEGFDFVSLKCIYEDSHKNLWLASNEGVYRADLHKFHIETKLFPFFKDLKINRVRQVLQHPNPNFEWVATSLAGLYLYDESQKKVIRKFDFAGKNITEIKYDSKGRLWVLATGEIRIIDPNYNTKSIFFDDFKRNLVAWTMNFDDKNDVWLTSEIGLIKVQENPKKINLYNQKQGISHEKVLSLSLLPDGKIALGTFAGIDIFDPKSERAIAKIGERNTVYVTNSAKTNTLWATYNGELIKIENFKIIKRWSQYNTNQKLLIKTNPYIDKAGKIWCNDVNGLLSFDPASEKFKLYTEGDGLINNYFFGQIYENKGQLYLNHDKGVNYFDPLQPKYFENAYKTVITDFSIFNKRQAVDLSKNEVFKVNYDENILTFDYAVSKYENPEKVLFRHQLEGFEKKWSEPNINRSTTYTNLDGGKYTFKVQAINEFGEVSSDIATFKIFVTTPYYRTWWFLMLVFTMILGIFYAVYRSRINRLLELQNLRYAISRDLHDEVGATLSSISMLSVSAQRALPEGNDRIKMLLENISKNTLKTLENIDDIVWAINPREEEFSYIINRMKEYAITMADSKDIELKWNIDANLNKLNVSMQQRRNMYLIFKESVNNAAKHSACTLLSIELNLIHKNRLEMVIEDNGIGFDQTKNSNRNGLRNLQQRAKEINGELKIESERGTKVTFLSSV